MKLQRLQNVIRIIGNFSRRTPVRDLHMAFKLPYIYDYITKLCRQQEVLQNHENADVRNIGQGEPPDTGNVRRLSLAAVKHTTVQVTRLPL
jgi:hypothetical protein